MAREEHQGVYARLRGLRHNALMLFAGSAKPIKHA